MKYASVLEKNGENMLFPLLKRTETEYKYYMEANYNRLIVNLLDHVCTKCSICGYKMFNELWLLNGGWL